MIALTNETQTMLFFLRIFKFNVFEFNKKLNVLFFFIYDRNSNLNSHTRIFEPMAFAHDGCSYHQAKTSIGFWCRRDLNPGPLFDNKRLYQLS